MTNLEVPELSGKVRSSLGPFAATLTGREREVLASLLRPASHNQLDALRSSPAEEILTPEELGTYSLLALERRPPQPGLRTQTVMVMKATRLCNLRCTYCHSWREGPGNSMTFPVLAKATRDVLQGDGVRSVQFVWHGGEVTMRSVDFYRKALWLQEQFRRNGQRVANSVQTNGTNLTDEWVEFLAQFGFSVGVSLDGPPEIHDKRRVDRNGRSTSSAVHAGMARLAASGVPFGVLLVVTDEVVSLGAPRLLDYLLSLEIASVALLNVIPAGITGGPTGDHIQWNCYVEFLRELFGLWWPQHAQDLDIRELGTLVSLIDGRNVGRQQCIFAGDCMGQFLTIEPDGDVSACDKFVGQEEFSFGNLLRERLATLLSQSRQLAAVRVEESAANHLLSVCEWFQVCNGGCPHDRRLNEWLGAPGPAVCCGLAPLLEDIRERVRMFGVRPLSIRE